MRLKLMTAFESRGLSTVAIPSPPRPCQSYDKIIPGWERAKQNLSPSPLGLGCDDHRSVNQWGLLSICYLARYAASGQPIPLTLIHTRLWLNGPIATDSEWAPDHAPLGTDARVGTVLDDNRNLVTGTTQEVLAIRDQLNHEDQARVNGHLQQANQEALQLAQAALERQQAGRFDLPDPIKQPEWLKKNVHGKANRRSMTTAEMAEQTANQRERAKNTASPAPTPAPAAISVPRLAPTAVPPLAPTAVPSLAPTAVPSLAPIAVPPLAPTAVPPLASTASPPLTPTPRNPSPTPPPASTAPRQLEGRTRRRQRGNGDNIDYAVLASLKRR